MGSRMITLPTLVLNRSWTPINVTSVRRAIVMAFVDLARIVDVQSYELFSFDRWVQRGPTNGNVVQGVNVAFDVPEVVVVQYYDKVSGGGVVFSRRNLFRRDRFTCQYCKARPGTETLTIDHILPKSRGGKTTWENCVLACLACNIRKGSQTPEEANMSLQTRPKKPVWSPFYAFTKRTKRPPSWDAFISEAYWNVALEE
ncbi:MAG: HNH endonuclease [Planctomycetes bacterium]|nr:HNH endonuclease [Planctomycetota bacterium]